MVCHLDMFRKHLLGAPWEAVEGSTKLCSGFRSRVQGSLEVFSSGAIQNLGGDFQVPLDSKPHEVRGSVSFASLCISST